MCEREGDCVENLRSAGGKLRLKQQQEQQQGRESNYKVSNLLYRLFIIFRECVCVRVRVSALNLP